MSTSELHSIVVPMYEEELVAEEFVTRARAAFSTLPDYELILVDDGSTDTTFEIISRLAENDPHLKIVRFARNFGHQTAITAGIDLASGDTVTVIDADLQDPPELISDMVRLWREGADIVFAVRESRAAESAFKKMTASMYYRMLRRLTREDIPADAGDFRLMSRRATEALRAMREHSRYVRGLVGWMGMVRQTITYSRDPRHSGTTKYSLRKMLKLAYDGIVSFSTAPLQFAAAMGMFTALLGLVLALWVIVQKLSGGYVVPGWASTMVAILFLGGAQLVTLGVIGDYLGRVYDEVRRRPLYLVEEVRGFDPETTGHFDHSPVPVLRDMR